MNSTFYFITAHTVDNVKILRLKKGVRRGAVLSSHGQARQPSSVLTSLIVKWPCRVSLLKRLLRQRETLIALSVGYTGLWHFWTVN